MRMMIALIGSILLAAVSTQATPPRSAKVDVTIDRGLDFLVKDALAWKKEHNCVSCHHASQVIWSLREAKQSGRTVNEPILADLTKWVAESGDGKTGVARPPGIPKALNAKAVWFALALGADTKPDEMTRKGLKLLCKTMEGDQTENGSWLSWPDTRPPIFGNSDDSMTALATLAVQFAAERGDAEAIAIRDKGVQWLAKTKCDDDPQSVAMRLVLWKRLGRPANEWEPLAQQIKQRQNADGGWSQAKGMESDAWATGQALYALAHVGIKANKGIIARGQEFLIKTQREDGSWPMTSRPTTPGSKGATSLIPIVGAGSSWAVLGLVKSTPPAKPGPTR